MAKAIVEFCRDEARRLFNGEITGQELAAEVEFRRMPLFADGTALKDTEKDKTNMQEAG